MPMLDRRRLLKLGLFGAAAALAGCGPSDASLSPDTTTAASPSPAPSGTWDPSPSLSFPAGTTATIDLGATLPPGVRRGGIFSLAPTSVALPPGVTLSANGALTVTSPSPGVTSNIVFAYSEPPA